MLPLTLKHLTLQLHNESLSMCCRCCYVIRQLFALERSNTFMLIPCDVDSSCAVMLVLAGIAQLLSTMRTASNSCLCVDTRHVDSTCATPARSNTTSSVSQTLHRCCLQCAQLSTDPFMLTPSYRQQLSHVCEKLHDSVASHRRCTGGTYNAHSSQTFLWLLHYGSSPLPQR